MWKSKTFSNFERCGGLNNGVMGSWTFWFLDFNKHVAWNKRGSAKFGPFLINVLAETTKLWVENSQKINCRDVTFIREERVKTVGAVMFKDIWPIFITTFNFNNFVRSIFLYHEWKNVIYHKWQTQFPFTCSKSTKGTTKQSMKSVQI